MMWVADGGSVKTRGVFESIAAASQNQLERHYPKSEICFELLTNVVFFHYN